MLPNGSSFNLFIKIVKKSFWYLQGKATKSEGDTFKSQAQVVKAMSDPQYDKDPAYRQEIYDKLERSNLQF